MIPFRYLMFIAGLVALIIWAAGYYAWPLLGRILGAW